MDAILNVKGWVQDVTLSAPTLQNNIADADRFSLALQSKVQAANVNFDIELLRVLPDLLRQWNFAVRCVFCQDSDQLQVIHITSHEDNSVLAGLAIDLGTTRVVLRLCDLTTGEELGETAFDNPQITVGADILARLHFADQEGGLAQLHQLIIDGLNTHIANLCQTCQLVPQQILMLAIAGNTAMTHLFMKLNPREIIREPYIPVTNRPGWIKASDLNIMAAPLARILVFPNIGSYFGGDLIAGILFAGLNRKAAISILTDVGTNAEVVIGNQDWLMGCAGAAGPALEGGVAKMGMMASAGVIDRIVIDPDTYEFDFHTIDNRPPIGICGSGLIDLAAQLFLAGMIDIRGKLIPSECGDRLIRQDDIPHLIVANADESANGENLTISQTDLDSLIRSKAAMYTILETLTTTVGVAMEDLDAFYVAGTFGSFIKPQSAITIGMLPDLPQDRFHSLGNSSLGGATMALTARHCITAIDEIRDNITYLELNVNQDFMNRFSAAKFIPHTDPTRFLSVSVYK